MSQLAHLPKPRSCSPTRSSKPNIKPIIRQSPSRGSSNGTSYSSGGFDFTTRYSYLLPKAPVVVLESPQLAEILNYYPTDRELLEADICDFDINVESGIPFSGSVRVERKWKQMQEQLIYYQTYNELLNERQAGNRNDSEVQDITQNPVLLTELNDQPAAEYCESDENAQKTDVEAQQSAYLENEGRGKGGYQ